MMFVFFTALVSGVSIFINKFGMKGIDSTVFTFMKNIMVSLFLIAAIIGLREIKSLKTLSGKDWLSLVLIGLIGGSIPFVLFFKGLQLSSGAIGAFIHKTMFIFVGILAVFFLKERLSRKIFIPAVLLLAGNFLLLKITSFELSAGALMIFIATIFWSVENIISKKILNTIEPKVLAFGRLFFGSLFIMAYMAITGTFSSIFTLSYAQFAWIIITTPLLFLYVLTWYSGLKLINTTTATSILLLGSPITTLLSIIFLSASLTIAHAFRMLLILTGIITMVIFIEKKPYSEPTISTA